MKTRVCRLFGQNDLRVEEDNVAPVGEGQVLVAMSFGGICGSDLHYLSDGGIGTIRVKEPIILGHEASGRILAVGEGVEGLSVGDSVAVNPSRPCGACEYCKQSLHMHCVDMRFNGSAIRMPHEQGLFRERMIVHAGQCIKVPADVDLSALACAEPLAVCLHAANMYGDLAGKRVLVTGAGPIGALSVAVAIRGGASEVVVTDIHDYVLSVAEKMGASRSINVSSSASELEAYAEGKGYFDVVFECSAAPSAIRSAVSVLRPRGTLLQVGVVGDTPMPMNMLVAKELRVQGTHRFHSEFAQAVQCIVDGVIDVSPVVSGIYPIDSAETAFSVASDRSQSVKVQLQF